MQPLLSGGVLQLGMLYGGASGRMRRSRLSTEPPALPRTGPAVVIYGFLGCFLFAVPMVCSMVRQEAARLAAGSLLKGHVAST